MKEHSYRLTSSYYLKVTDISVTMFALSMHNFGELYAFRMHTKKELSRRETGNWKQFQSTLENKYVVKIKNQFWIKPFLKRFVQGKRLELS